MDEAFFLPVTFGPEAMEIEERIQCQVNHAVDLRIRDRTWDFIDPQVSRVEALAFSQMMFQSEGQ